jgi:hypothetical protein
VEFATCSALFILHDLLTQVMLDEEYKSWSSLLQENIISSSLSPQHPVLEYHQLIFIP